MTSRSKSTSKKILPFLIAATLATPAFAGHKNHYDYARVVNAEPITKTIRVSTPRQECWNEQVSHYQQPKPRSATPMIVGAIVGGLLGNEIGHHKDAKRVGVAAGAILGGSIGRDIGRKHAGPGHHYYTDEQVCKTYDDYHEEERITGYHVSYKYHGKLYHTRTAHHPGDRIKVRVSVTPVKDY